MSLNYKCIGCGAPISFSPRTGGFKCEYCMSEYSEEELTRHLEAQEAKKGGIAAGDAQNAADNGAVKQYHCRNCGAEVVAGETSSASFCYYCHSPVVLADRLAGNFKPDKVLPFKIDKKQAIQAFKEWTRGKFYLPRDFTSAATQEKITGIYLPYWQTDITAAVDYHGVGVAEKKWQRGDTEYIQTDKYRIDRTGTVTLNNLQELAFTKIDRNLINAISPYDEAEQKDFSMGYLPGFFAEQYDIPSEKSSAVCLERAKEQTQEVIRNSLDYASVEDVDDRTGYTIDACRQVLLPAWVLTYRFQGKTHVFAVNGQTGKSAGDLPVDTTRLALFSGLLAAVVAVLLILGGLFLW